MKRLTLLLAAMACGCQPAGPSSSSGPPAPPPPPGTAVLADADPSSTGFAPVGPGELDGSSEAAFKRTMRELGDQMSTADRLALIVALQTLVKTQYPEGEENSPEFDQRMRAIAHGRTPRMIIVDAQQAGAFSGSGGAVPGRKPNFQFDHGRSASSPAMPRGGNIPIPGGTRDASLPKNRAPPPAPEAIDPAREVYLRDLAPVAATVLQRDEHRLVRDFAVAGVAFQHGLYTHPPEANRPAQIAFSLGRQFQRLRGSGGQRDGLPPQSASPLTLRIVGNGQDLWSTPAFRTHGQWYPFDLDIGSVDRLELIADCPGDHSFAWAVWLDPVLIKK
jgi:hypothetical protein